MRPISFHGKCLRDHTLWKKPSLNRFIVLLNITQRTGVHTAAGSLCSKILWTRIVRQYLCKASSSPIRPKGSLRSCENGAAFLKSVTGFSLRWRSRSGQDPCQHKSKLMVQSPVPEPHGFCWELTPLLTQVQGPLRKHSAGITGGGSWKYKPDLHELPLPPPLSRVEPFPLRSAGSQCRVL